MYKEDKKLKCLMCKYRANGEDILLIKPTTYMNLSGEAVSELVHKYKVEKGHLIVAYDDIDIPLGSVRIRKEGSAGTHNGMRNIIKMISTTDFPRVRIGTGKQTQLALVDFVLSQLTEEDKKIADVALDNAADALLQFIEGTDIDIVMQKHNVKASAC